MERKFCINWEGIIAEAKYQRKQRKITQRRLALLAQVSEPTISKFESGAENIEIFSVLRILHVLGLADKRNIIFPDKDENYDRDRRIILFRGQMDNREILCAISTEALEDHFKGNTLLQKFRKNRMQIEQIARRKYLYNELEPDGSIFIRSKDLL